MKKSIFGLIFITVIHGGYCQEAQIFEPGIISLPETWDEYITFSPDAKVLAFNRRGKDLGHRGYRIYLSKKVSGKWTTPVQAPFSKSPYQDRSPAFSPDGQRIYFSSNRPTDGSDGPPSRRSDIWYSVKDGSGWGEPIWLGDEVNLPNENEVHPAITESGNLYFVRWGSSETDIYFSKLGVGAYELPVKLGNAINTVEGPDSHPSIDPKERFLIYTPTDREDGYGGGDIYISYKDKSGKWSKAKNIGSPVNSEWYEYSAKISGDSIYFTRAGFGKPENKPADIYFIKLSDVGIRMER